MTPHYFLEIVSAVLGLSGALLLAVRSRFAGWAFVLWLGSNTGWVVFGALAGHWGLVAQHAGFAITSALGVWTWLLRPAWLARRGVV
jgi:hypothetical protein